MPNEPNPPSQQDDLGVIIIEEASLRESFTQIPNTILKRKDLSPGAKLTYVALLSYAWQAGSCYPGQATLAEAIGVGQRSVVRYMKELQDSGLLDVKRRGLGRTNLYTLSSWVKAKKGSLPDTEQPPRAEVKATTDGGQSRSANLALQEVPGLADQQVPNWRTEEYTESKQTQCGNTQSSNHFEGDPLDITREDFHFSKKRDFEDLKFENANSSGRASTDSRPSGNGFTAVGDVVRTRRRKTPQAASDGPGGGQTPDTGSRANPSQASPAEPPRTGGRRSLAAQATPDITAVIEQISDELHDDAPRSSLGRAVRLWKESKQSEGAFIAALYAARKATKQRADIQKRASGEAGAYGLRNRMPYFLATLSDVLGLKQEASTTS